jgi:CRP/FNR family transcriptional regulator, anaerobic regulatory protein
MPILRTLIYKFVIDIAFMPILQESLTPFLSHLNPVLVEEICLYADIVTFPARTGLLKRGQYVKVVPIVISGLLKVFTQNEEKELLLYYIQPNEGCVMSFAAVLNNDSSKIYAVSEEESSVLLLPAEKLNKWTSEYSNLSNIFYRQYYTRYNELIETIQELVFLQLDKRILNYLKLKAQIKGSQVLTVMHKEIANDLGSSREAVTRTLKKLEAEGLLLQTNHTIELY